MTAMRFCLSLLALLYLVGPGSIASDLKRRSPDDGVVERWARHGEVGNRAVAKDRIRTFDNFQR